MTNSLYASDENEKAQRPLLDSPTNNDSTHAATAISAGDVVVFDKSCEKEPCVTIVSDSKRDVPKDKFFVVYVIFLLFGIATLLPWNIFITATDYFVKFKLNTNESANSTYRNNFVFAVGTVGQFTNVAMNLFNILVVFGGNPKNRIPYTLVLCSVVILFHVAMAIVDSSEWPFVFFIFCLVSVFLMYVATGILNSCIFYVVSIFPMEYVNAIIVGTNLSGIFTTFMSIGSKASSPNLRIAAIYYFLSAFIILMLALIGYFLMHKMVFYKYWAQVSEDNKKNTDSKLKVKVPYFAIIKKIWLLLFCIWLNFFSTLAIFPVFQLGIKRSCESFIINDFWFQDVVTFLTFNVLVTLGNMLPKLVKWPGPKWIPIPVILRAIIVFIFFALCNFKPSERNNIPILIQNDYVYWFGAGLSPFIFGYFTSLLMMYTPRQVEPEHAGTASMISALTLAIGVVSGLQFTKVLEWIVLA